MYQHQLLPHECYRQIGDSVKKIHNFGCTPDNKSLLQMSGKRHPKGPLYQMELKLERQLKYKKSYMLLCTGTNVGADCTVLSLILHVFTSHGLWQRCILLVLHILTFLVLDHFLQSLILHSPVMFFVVTLNFLHMYVHLPCSWITPSDYVSIAMFCF